MIIEYLIKSALASGRLVITQPKQGYYHLKVKLGGAYITLSRVVALMDDTSDKQVESVEASMTEESAKASAKSAQILAFSRTEK